MAARVGRLDLLTLVEFFVLILHLLQCVLRDQMFLGLLVMLGNTK